ncbi:hypothetical protein FGK63_04055 [Ruegeria sediminis]|uniref:Uncharacterized protein n=1 Tax=Ruegeria sediminis TaxID=2583820 RepID=A0ABY2X5B7_9RHOB|nr:hypothetical protein [Ruegeria sediminis]TMV10245.1 hypothetical protein FGK63_04055 [Ruegeria sediminis]
MPAVRRQFTVALAICVAGAAQAQNRQPISTSLTECSVIFTELADLGARRGKDEDTVNAALVSASLFLVEAREQAGREGTSEPYGHIQSEQDRLAEKWEGRFSSLILLNENKDWIDYCRALGKNRGLALP